jgi:hypothetical protein
MSNNVVKIKPTAALTVFDAPLGQSATATIAFARELQERRIHYGNPKAIHHRNGTPGMLQMAAERRAELAYRFPSADAAWVMLSDMLMTRLDKLTAAKMVTALYGALGMKCKPDMLKGAIEVLKSDAIGDATGLWRSVDVTPAVLALACHKVMAKQIYELKPAELLEACREARNASKAHIGKPRNIATTSSRSMPSCWRTPAINGPSSTNASPSCSCACWSCTTPAKTAGTLTALTRARTKIHRSTPSRRSSSTSSPN